MIKKADWDSLLVSVYDHYSEQGNNIANAKAKGNCNRATELDFIIYGRYVKVLDHQNIKEDTDQFEDGFKDYDEARIQNALGRINLIYGTVFNIPVVYDYRLDKIND